MSDYLQVENHSGLIRDMRSKAILVTDRKAYEEFKKRRDREKRLLSIEEKLDTILKMGITPNV